MDETIAKIRAFNRFYMPSMNLLGDHYLGSEYSITEARYFSRSMRMKDATLLTLPN